MKKILLSGGLIVFVAAVVLGATGAFFSDTETSTGNVFTAGSLDLKVDSTCHYWTDADGDGQYESVECLNLTDGPFGTWNSTDLLDHKFFNFADVKPGDKGENTISLTPVDNDAYICAYVTNLENNDNGINEPESAVDQTDGVGNGELQDNIHLMIWEDNGENQTGGENGVACDNIHQAGEPILVQDTVIDNNYGGWLLGEIPGGETSCLGVAWNVPEEVGNIIQTDSVSADISFYAEQVRNNPDFSCPGQLIVESRHVSLENKTDNWAIISDDQTYGDIEYSHNDTTLHGVVTGTGLVPNSKYQITLNGPGTCTFTDDGLAHVGPNAFSSGYWNNGTNLEPTCGNPGEGVYNMDLISNWYTVETDGSGAFVHNFSIALPAGNYSGVKVLVKKMLDPFVSPWADFTAAYYPEKNLYETASISFTIVTP